VKMSLTAIGGTYEGKLSADGKSITGNWSQGPNPLPLNLTRATPETEPRTGPRRIKFDIDAQPDGEGAPSEKEWKGMLQKLIVERFKLTFHRDKKELSVYVVSVAKAGQKLTKSEGDPNGLPGLFFHALGDLHVTNANMADFAGLIQEAVLDRPVLDQTGLNGRFDFTLKWTPDDSQFGGMGAKIPPSTDTATVPPGAVLPRSRSR
jgi:uncharacterized protein (TIGR03435 family)